MNKSLVHLLLIVILVLTAIVGSDRLVHAQSITGINAEISSLRSRINRLESEVRNLSRAIPGSSPVTPRNLPERELPPTTIENPPAIDGNVVGRSDPLFERLATLVIELKEDVRNLDRRLTALEEE
ncbi:MAG TPA: hypothetical protein ACFCUY_06360 [Xenococcaceae cyanobacterium]